MKCQIECMTHIQTKSETERRIRDQKRNDYGWNMKHLVTIFDLLFKLRWEMLKDNRVEGERERMAQDRWYDFFPSISPAFEEQRLHRIICLLTNWRQNIRSVRCLSLFSSFFKLSSTMTTAPPLYLLHLKHCNIYFSQISNSECLCIMLSLANWTEEDQPFYLR